MLFMVYFTCISTAIKILNEIRKSSVKDKNLLALAVAMLIINICSLAYFIVMNIVKQVKFRKKDMKFEEFYSKLNKIKRFVGIQRIIQYIFIAVTSVFIILVFTKAGFDYIKGIEINDQDQSLAVKN
jgi:competence protein ComGF